MTTPIFTRSRALLSSNTLSRSTTTISSTRTYVSSPAACSLRRFLFSISATTTARRFSTKEASAFDSLSPSSFGSHARSNHQPNVKREDIMLDGCDFEHWLIMMEKPEGEPSREDIIDSYIKTLAKIVGSEEEARMKIYSVSTKHYYAFSCLLPEEVAKKLNGLPGVSWVLPDAYVDFKNKDYGGEPFINGEAVPYDPKYHEEWVRNNSRSKEKTTKADKPKGGNRNRPPAARNSASKEKNGGHGSPDAGIMLLSHGLMV